MHRHSAHHGDWTYEQSPSGGGPWWGQESLPAGSNLPPEECDKSEDQGPGEAPRAGGTCRVWIPDPSHHCTEPPRLLPRKGHEGARGKRPVAVPQSAEVCGSRSESGGIRPELSRRTSPLPSPPGGARQRARLRVWGPGHLKSVSRHLQAWEDTWLCLGPERAAFLVGSSRSLVEPEEPGGKMKNKVFGNYHSFFPSSPPLLPFQVDRGEACPSQIFCKCAMESSRRPGHHI